jgi:hypothetical protein
VGGDVRRSGALLRGYFVSAGGSADN